ncbi:MAG TPA: multicopper oxidase family protein [Candidatus Rubrimentiphilum sp.]|nr:multicopper oxidase family protein [Candidatus Rubrimentiphilum sp.]
MRRSHFLQASAGAMTVLTLPHLSSRALASDVVDYTLTAAPMRFSPAARISFDGLAFNGSIPGPLLRIVHGQRLRAKFNNNTGQGSTIHWHGMILPNSMDGAEGVTQAAVRSGDSFVYEFLPDPPGTRWYHDHVSNGLLRGLFGMVIVEDPRDQVPDAEFALVFHDVPRMSTVNPAMRGVGNAPMTDPLGSPELTQMPMDDKMGDEIAFIAHCINGAAYPNTKRLPVKVGQHVRLRILNANPTETRYVRLAGHRLVVTHSDGNPLPQPVEVDALRVGVAERYDAWFEVNAPGAWLLQGLSSDPLAYEQAAVVHTESMENAPPMASTESLEGVDYFTYQNAGGTAGALPPQGGAHYDFTLDDGKYGSSRWTINGQTYPYTPKIFVHRNDIVSVRLLNKTDMDHPMHLHGHVFEITGIDDVALARPLPKDTSLVRANGGTLSWRFRADSPPGRWLLHCHNAIHMMDGMMTEVVYRA